MKIENGEGGILTHACMRCGAERRGVEWST